MNASKVLSGPKDKTAIGVEKAELIEAVRQALYMSKICSYAQGFTQLKALLKNMIGTLILAHFYALERRMYYPSPFTEH